MEIEILHQLFLKSSGVVIDSRKVIKNSLFIAINGVRFDANTLAQEALANGASYVVIDNKDFYTNEKTILVDDSLTTLQELAKFHRNYLKIPIIALTGSNGKTTTKELIQVVLSQKFYTKATIGNLNNHIGVPLTLLTFDATTEMGIVEMGANHQKEIEFLCDLAQPDYGYITNFGKAHLEGFGGVEGVIKGKSEMYAYLVQNNKKVVVNLEDPIQVQKTVTLDIIGFGHNRKEAFVNISTINANPFVTIGWNGSTIQSHLIGLYNANNIIAAITFGKYFGIADEAIKKAIESFVPDNNRSQLLHKDTNEIILDAYNANPSSMKVALDNFVQLEKSNKIAFLGGMFELGSESSAEHKTIIELIAQEQNITFCFIGSDFYANKIEQSNCHFFEDFEALSLHLQHQKFQNATILIKGSRGMALERTLDYL